jgi:hypothetical protein
MKAYFLTICPIITAKPYGIYITKVLSMLPNDSNIKLIKFKDNKWEIPNDPVTSDVLVQDLCFKKMYHCIYVIISEDEISIEDMNYYLESFVDFRHYEHKNILPSHLAKFFKEGWYPKIKIKKTIPICFDNL